MSDDWYQLFSVLHRIAHVDLRANGGKVNWSHYGRCISALLNNPIGIEGFTPWRVCGITAEALELMVSTKGTKGIERGHIVSQLELAKMLLAPNIVREKVHFENVISKYDVTVLMTKEQNQRMTRDADMKYEYISIDGGLTQKYGELFPSTYRGYQFRKKKELLALQDLLAQPSIQVRVASDDLRAQFVNEVNK